LCSSLHVRNQVLHPYKTTGKIIVLYILIFVFLFGILGGLSPVGSTLHRRHQ
jgi:hypothetical protein